MTASWSNSWGATYGLPTIELAGFEVDPEAIKLLSRGVAEKHTVIPVSRAGKTLVVAFADPSNIFVKDDLAMLTRSKIEVVIASEAGILAAIDKYYGGSQKIENLISEMEEAPNNSGRAQVDFNVETVDQTGGENEDPIVKIGQRDAGRGDQDQNVRHPHRAVREALRVRFRIDGALVERFQPPANAAAPSSVA